MAALELRGADVGFSLRHHSAVAHPLFAAQPEVRYRPADAGSGHYLGVHASAVGFNASTCGDYRYQDPNRAAFGLGIGYAFHLDKARRLSLEAQIGRRIHRL